MKKILKFLKIFMKKPIKLTFVIFFIFIVCFSLSVIIKQYFGIDGDYLSAFSTLVAAVVAYFLFTDWREQYVLDLIRESGKNTNITVNQLISSTQEFRNYVNKIVKDGVEAYSPELFTAYGNKFIDDCEFLLLDLDSQLLILKNAERRFGIDKAAIENLETIIDEVTQKIKGLSLKHLIHHPLEMCNEVSLLLGKEKFFENRLRQFRYVLKNNINFVVDAYLNNKGA